jgi:hypothetical protein
MHKLLLSFICACALLNTGCGAIQNLANKNTASPTPIPSPTLKPDYSKPFRAVVDDLTKIPAKVIPGDGYIKGPPVKFFQSNSLEAKEKKEKPRWVHDDNPLIGKLMHAQTPEEAQTVVLQKCDEISFGLFAYMVGDTVVGDKIPSYGWKCEITVIDRTIPAIVGRKNFETEKKEREMVSEKTKEIRLTPPFGEIKKYLDSLPTK